MRSRLAMMIVRGNFAEGNFGDDALLLAVQGLVATHYVAEQVCFEGGAPAYRKGLPGYDRAARGDEIHRAEVILYGGGTQFFAFGAPAAESPELSYRVARAALEPRRLLASFRFRRRIRLESKVPVMGVGLGFGPFIGSAATEESARRLAARMQFLWARDEETAEFARRAGSEAVISGPDLCFLPEFQRAHLGARGSRGDQGAKRVGIVLRDWPHGAAASTDVGRWVEVARQCRAAGIQAAFFSFSPKRDAVMLRELREAGEETCCWNPARMTVQQYSDSLDECQMLLTSRFHAAIFALLFEKPFLAISIEPKLRIAARLLGASEHVVEPTAEPAEVAARIIGMMDCSPELRAKAGRAREEQTRRAVAAKAQFDAAIVRLRSAG